MAEIYLERAEHESHLRISDHGRVTAWLSRADALLGRAMAINAGCAHGRRLLDRLHESSFYDGRTSAAVDFSPGHSRPTM